jgi:predicted dithiol-disulfide oxidoreductase (DUF899 family)
MNESHSVVSHQEWIEARKRFLLAEKELTHARDRLSEQRRALPWERVDKPYTFETASGRRSLAELFEEKSQLVVYHFMFGPAENSTPCRACSFWADNFNGVVSHLKQRDVNMVAISRAPLSKLQAHAKRLGWSFPWHSSNGSDFNHDYAVSFDANEVGDGQLVYNYATDTAKATEMPGISVFSRSANGALFHTYSTFARGLDMLNSAYHYLDLVPKGRDEAGLSHPMAWLRMRDEY